MFIALQQITQLKIIILYEDTKNYCKNIFSLYETGNIYSTTVKYSPYILPVTCYINYNTTIFDYNRQQICNKWTATENYKHQKTFKMKRGNTWSTSNSSYSIKYKKPVVSNVMFCFESAKHTTHRNP